jgi:hypothetical protein
MSTETTNKKIKIDNGTTFGRTYTDKAVDELLKGVGGAKIIKGYLSGFTTYQKGKAEYDITMDSSVTYDGTPKIFAVYTNNTYSVLMGLIPLSAQINKKTGAYDYWGELTTIAKTNSTSGSGQDSLRVNYQHWAVSLSSEQNKIIIEPMSIAPNYASGNSGKYLRVSSDGYNLEWGDVNLPIVEGTDGANNTITIQDSQSQPFILKVKNTTGYNYIYMNIIYNSTYNRYEYYGSSFITSDNLMIVTSGYGTTLTESLNNTLKDDYKTISLFGEHSILVPKNSADTNIDIYNHSITIGKPNDTYINGFTLLLPSSSNLVVDSIQDLNTILGTTPRMIPVSGCYNPGTPVLITRLNWKGSFANSTLITTGGEEEDILSTFTSIGDVVTTL